MLIGGGEGVDMSLGSILDENGGVCWTFCRFFAKEVKDTITGFYESSVVESDLQDDAME